MNMPNQGLQPIRANTRQRLRPSVSLDLQITRPKGSGRDLGRAARLHTHRGRVPVAPTFVDFSRCIMKVLLAELKTWNCRAAG
jgi:hypothetical protein